MKEIMIDGVRYLPVDECGEIKIVVLDRGLVYVGRYFRCGDEVTIRDARCIIRWGTTQHLGELVSGPLENTKLGAINVVTCNIRKVIHTVEVSQDAWHISG